MKRRLKVLILVVAIFLSGVSLSAKVLGVEKKSSKVTLTVFAASSLNKTFLALGKIFTEQHPGVSIRFSFLSSSTLATQIIAGAPADLFASASQADMAMAENMVLAPTIFAANRIVLATPKRNSFHIRKIADLDKPGVKWIQCTPSAPCGVAADAALSSQGNIKSKPVSLEQKVASVVSKLISGEVDAALIYHTDYVAHAHTLNEISFRNLKLATTLYLVGVVKSSDKKSLSESFVNLLLSSTGRNALAKAGYLNYDENAP